MQLLCVLVLLFFAQLGRAQSTTYSAETVSIDLGWVAAVQQERGWQVVNAPDPPPTYKGARHLQIGDVLLIIDGHDASRLGPLAVARMLEDVPVRKVPVSLERSGQTIEMQLFGEGVFTDGTIKTTPSYSPQELQKRDDAAPPFSLFDLQGHQYTAALYRGSWVLLTVWGTWCSGCLEEIPALNYLSRKYSARVKVLSVDLNDELDTLQHFLTQHPVSYPVLLGGSFDDSFAHSYNVHLAPTNVIIAPTGNIAFVGRGNMSLKGAVETIARAQRRAGVRP
jgi:thiol-disulfide isomerase/thioredoxin